MFINKTKATELLRAAANGSPSPSAAWEEKLLKFSRLCERAPKTHVAFLGTSILAKATDPDADLFAVKPEHSPDNPNAYSARTLCHAVLVPLAAELGYNIGVTGREPLNNMPYFRMNYLGDDTPVHKRAQAVFAYMLELVGELDALEGSEEAREALAAFVSVRRTYQTRYADKGDASVITPEQLRSVIGSFVRENAEGGRRAQAVVAGLFDVVYGVDRVESGRINDPSRKYPGDVCVRDGADPEIFIKAVEVRDKPVALSDVHIFGKKCVDMGVLDAAVAMVSDKQQTIDGDELAVWASGFGLGMTLFHGWDDICDQTLYWSDLPKPEAAGVAADHIRNRLLLVEVSTAGVDLWDELILA